MADTRKYVQGQDYTLAGSGIVSAATTAVLSSFATPDGTLITMTDFGTLGYITFEPETSLEENASFTGVTQNADGTATLTGLTKALGFVAPYTAVAALDIAHAGGTTVRVANSAPFYNEFANKANDETITGIYTFPNDASTPVLGTVYAAPTTDLQIASKKYADDIAVAGAPDASTSTKGITKLSTAPASATNPIAVGDNDTRVPNADTAAALAGNEGTPSATNLFVTQEGFQEATETYAASSAASDTYAITLAPAITSYVDGMVIRFEADVQNTGAATLNVNALGAKNIEKGAATALATADIQANTTVTVVYNATNDNFQIQSNPGIPISETLIDAKGDSLWGTADNTIARQAAGTNEHVIVYDSAQTAGIRTEAKIIENAGIATYDLTTASGTQVIAHGLAKTPVNIEFMGVTTGTTNDFTNGWSNGSSHRSVTMFGGTAQNSTSFCMVAQQAGASQSATCAMTDSTNFTLTWTKGGSPTGTINILWRAKA